MKHNRKNTALLLLLIGLMVCLLAACGNKSEEPEQEEARIINPLTGSEEYDANGKRAVAIVVENAPDARPQWGLDDENYSPDVVVQGEVEGGITRTLWLYADFTKLPEIVGPIRSARPPFIKFSELFDSIFIHWGQSSSKGDYKGANTVFKEDNVDHINQMTYSDSVGLYDRDNTRSVSSEHRGILYGDKVAAAIEDNAFSTDAEEYSGFQFRETAEPMSENTCGDVTVRYSSHTDTTTFKYNEEDEKYHTSDFDNDFDRENLIILYDKTNYITKENYMGKGYAVTYCDYLLYGGQGKVISQGTEIDITWAVEDGRLVLRMPLTEEQKEEYAKAKEEADSGEEVEKPLGEVVQLNPGKSWIGWISDNNGGSVSITELPKEEPAEESDGE